MKVRFPGAKKIAQPKAELKAGTELESSAAEVKADAPLASKKMRAVLGDVAAPKRAQPKSAGARAAIDGVERHRAARKKPRTGLKKGVVALMIGLTLMNATAPAMAEMGNNPVPPQQVEQVVEAPAKGTMDVLSLQMYELSDGMSVEIEAEATVEETSAKAYERFEHRVRRVLHHDAASLAEGHTPTQPGEVTALQNERLLEAAGDFFMELPLGAFGESVASPIRAMLGDLGVDTSNIDQTPLKNLGDGVGDAAVELAKRLADEHPVAFWSVAGVATAGVATYGYLEGSDALEDLGIRPEISKRFGDFRVGVGAEWSPRFEDFAPRLSLGYQEGAWHGSTALNLNLEGDLSMSSQVLYRPSENFFVGARANYQFETDTFDASISAGYQPNSATDIQLRGSVVNGDAQIGIGFTARF